MPRTRGIVDSLPIDKPPTRPGPVKRSGSLASLPTPPRTHTKRKRARSRVTDSDSEEDESVVRRDSSGEETERVRDHPSGRRSAHGALVLGNKKRKTLDDIAEELSEAKAEEAFWMGTSTAETHGGQGSARSQGRSQYRLRSPSRTRSPSSSPPPAAHLLRRGHTGLASPPPSRCQPRTHARIRKSPPRPVSSRAKRLGLFPTRDSPNNPFLEDDSAASVPESTSASLPEPRTPERFVEKPTMTWVFRGTKVQLANPHYKSPGAPSDGSDDEAASLLPEDHPDYSPPPTYAPKLLFPEARQRDLARRRGRRPPAAESSDALPPPTVTSTRPMQKRSGGRSDSSVESVASSPDSEAVSKGKQSSVKPREEDVEAALEAAMAQRLARRLGSSHAADGEAADGPRTRTRASGAPRLPEKDSDPARRAMGPIRVASPPSKKGSY